MLIIKSKELERELSKYLEIKSLNIDYVNMMLDIINNCHDDFNEDNVMYEQGEFITTKYENLLIHISGLDSKDQTEKYVIDNFIRNNVTKLDIEKYKTNEYYKNIHINNVKFNNLEITKLKYEPYEMFFSCDVNSNENNYYLDSVSIGFFEEEYEYIALLQDNVIWMLITPNEINTMEQSIKEANGNVLALGLGLGYYPYMISLKDEVKKITIVENNRDIIELFKNNIFNQFKNKNKIEIIEDDAIKYCKNNCSNFDYVFVDIFHDSIEAYNTLFDIKKIERENKKTKFSYWLFKGTIDYTRRCLLSLIESYYYNEKYQPDEEIEKNIINRLDIFYKNKLIDNSLQLKNILSDKEIENFLLNCY